MKIIHNNKMVSMQKPVLNVRNQGFQLGYGIFETIKIMEHHPCFFNEHYDRLMKGCALLELSTTFTREILLKQVYTIINANKMSNGALKIIYTRNEPEHDLVIMSRNLPYTPEKYQQGFSLCVSEIRRNPLSPLLSIKTTSYIENMYAREKAIKKGHDDALFLNTDGCISETSIANLFWVTKNTLYTPAENCGLLPGITRTHILLLAMRLGLQVEEGAFPYETLLEADEVFITNALMGIMPVSQIDEQTYRVAGYEVTNFLHNEYLQILQEDHSSTCS